MVLLATAVSLAVYFIMQPDDGTTKSESATNVTFKDVVAYVESVEAKIDPLEVTNTKCQAFEDEITGKSWKTKDTQNVFEYYQAVGVGWFLATSTATLNPVIKFAVGGNELTQTTSLLGGLIPDTVQTWR